MNALVKERKVAQTVGECVVIIYCRFLEYAWVWLEKHLRSRLFRVANYRNRCLRMSVSVFLHIDMPVAAHFGTQI